MFVQILPSLFQETCRKFIPHALYLTYFLGNRGYIYMKIPPILCEVLCSAFVLTGYLGQEDDLYTGREALIVHLLGGGSNHVAFLA